MANAQTSRRGYGRYRTQTSLFEMAFHAGGLWLVLTHPGWVGKLAAWYFSSVTQVLTSIVMTAFAHK